MLLNIWERIQSEKIDICNLTKNEWETYYNNHLIEYYNTPRTISYVIGTGTYIGNTSDTSPISHIRTIQTKLYNGETISKKVLDSYKDSEVIQEALVLYKYKKAIEKEKIRWQDAPTNIDLKTLELEQVYPNVQGLFHCKFYQTWVNGRYIHIRTEDNNNTLYHVAIGTEMRDIPNATTEEDFDGPAYGYYAYFPTLEEIVNFCLTDTQMVKHDYYPVYPKNFTPTKHEIKILRKFGYDF